jgi:hypothetical protein
MAGGGVVTFGCDGTITLAVTITNDMDTVFDGAGHLVTLSGGNAVQVIHVNSGTHLTVANLTIANGLGLWGGGIYNETGTVDLMSVTLRNNVATNAVLLSAEGGNGGGIYNQGTVNATNCLFTDNAARQRDTVDSFPGEPVGYLSTPCLGGAIYNGGQLNLFNCSFNGNGAYAAPGYQYWFYSPFFPAGGSAGRKGAGGAIFSSGSLNASFCTFANNAANSGWSVAQPATSLEPMPGLAGTEADGGAICSLGPMVISSSSFVGNRISGGAGGVGGVNGSGVPGAVGGLGGAGNGGALFNGGGGVIANCALIGNVASGGQGGSGGYGTHQFDVGFSGGPGGGGGSAAGGALFNGGTLSLINCTLTGNSATGGGGGTGGAGAGGGVVVGGQGGDGGPGGAGLSGFTAQAMVNCTIAFNIGNGGAGGSGGSGGAAGGNGHYPGHAGDGGRGGNGGSGVSCFNADGMNCTIANNLGNAGLGGSGGAGGANGGTPVGPPGAPGSTGTNGTTAAGLIGGNWVNTLMASNRPVNCAGNISDGGHNLSSDASCNFTNVGSLNNTDPKLGPLASNGGPTLTMALLPGSPAINAGASAGAPTTDQRGVTRPQGTAVDIGAYEFRFTIPAITGAKFQSSTNFWLQLCGLPNQKYTIQASTNLVNWSDITTCVANTNGVFEFVDCNLSNCNARFYRLKFSAP